MLSRLFITRVKKLAVEEDEQVFFCCVILAILMISSSPLMAKDALHNEIIQFDIPRQQADMSLIKFAEQADLTLIVPFDQVRKITTNRLSVQVPDKRSTGDTSVGHWVDCKCR